MKITEHFDSSEFAQPAKHGMTAEPYPMEWYHDRLTPLCEVLEAIRAHFAGAPMTILSGYRSEDYNVALYTQRGEPPTHSQHSQGKAADIVIANVSTHNLHVGILGLYRQGLIKIGGLGLYEAFVHVDIRDQVPAGHLAQWTGYGS